MLLAELLDDLRPGCRPVAENASARAVHERVDDDVRKPVWVRRERHRCHDAHQLPVPGRRVLALRAFQQATGDRGRPRLGRATLERLDVSKAERLEVRQVEAADGPGDIAERVGALVSVIRRVRQLPRADGVKNYDARTRHAAILRGMSTALGLIGLAGYVIGMLILAAGVTALMVKISPMRSK